MMCPMISHQKQYASDIACREIDCAWWDRSKECCAILSLAKMPLETIQLKLCEFDTPNANHTILSKEKFNETIF